MASIPTGAFLPNGTILILGVRFTSGPDKVFTYVLLRAGGYWYTSGTGPQAASWSAVTRWLSKDGRELVSVARVTETEQIWPPPDPTSEAG